MDRSGDSRPIIDVRTTVETTPAAHVEQVTQPHIAEHHEGLLERATHFVENLGSNIASTLTAGFHSTKESVASGAHKAGELAHHASESVADTAGSAADTVYDTTNAAIDKAKETLHMTSDKAQHAYESGKEKAGSMADTAKERTSQAVETGGNIVDRAMESAGQTYDAAKDKMGDAWDKTKSVFGQGDTDSDLARRTRENLQISKDKAGGVMDTAKEKTSDFMEAGGNIVDKAKDSVGQTYDAAKEKLGGAWDKTKEVLGGGSHPASATDADMVRTTREALRKGKEKGMGTVENLSGGTQESTNQYGDVSGNFAEKVQGNIHTTPKVVDEDISTSGFRQPTEMRSDVNRAA